MNEQRTDSAPSEHYEAYWEALSSADLPAALAALHTGMDAGEPRERLVRDVISRGQEEVGRLWEAGHLSIADEHAASSVTEQALAALRPRRPVSNPRARRVVLACPEGEWHTLPARIAADLAAFGGIDVTVTGGSLPAEDLGLFLRHTRPDALALSVTITGNLVSAWRSIQAAHLVGVPVIVGGAAWGNGVHRAYRLGADFRVDDPIDAARALNLLAGGRPLRQSAPIPAEAEYLSTWGNPWARSLEVETMLARAASAAVACADPSVLDEVETWLTRPAGSGGITTETLRTARLQLAERLLELAPAAAALLRGEDLEMSATTH